MRKMAIARHATCLARSEQVLEEILSRLQCFAIFIDWICTIIEQAAEGIASLHVIRAVATRIRLGVFAVCFRLFAVFLGVFALSFGFLAVLVVSVQHLLVFIAIRISRSASGRVRFRRGSVLQTEIGNSQTRSALQHRKSMHLVRRQQLRSKLLNVPLSVLR